MSIYAKLISETIGVTDHEVLAEVEEIMRDVIFHSTLDWQSREQFDEGAKLAYEVYQEMKTEEQVG